METPPRRLRATDATPAAVGMTGLAWLMGAEQRTLGKDPGQLAANALETPNGTPWTPRMELVTSPGSDGAFSNAVSPSPAGFGPSSVAATRGNGPTGSVPESPTLEAKKSLGPVRTDSASSVDSLGSIGNAATVTPRQVSSIMDQSKKVIGHLRRLAQEEQNFDLMEPNGTLPTYENLVSRLMDKFRFQKEVNSANARLFSMSYIVQMHNYARTRQVMKDVQRGKREIMSLQHNLRDLEHTVEEVTVDLEAQKAQAEMFKSNLDNTRSLLDRVMVDYRDELSRHREVLRRQQRYLGSMYSAKLSQDLALDLFICLFGLYFVSHPFIRHPLDFLGTSLNQLIPTVLRRDEITVAQKNVARQRGVFIQRLMRILAFVALVRNARDLAMSYGLHNQVGKALSYWTFLSDNLRNKLFGAEDVGPQASDRLLEEGERQMFAYRNLPARQQQGAELVLARRP